MMDLHLSKEAFYANLTGTTPFEVSLVVAVAPASELLRWTLVPVLVTLFGSVVKNIWYILCVVCCMFVLDDFPIEGTPQTPKGTISIWQRAVSLTNIGLTIEQGQISVMV